jgi:DNA/RNA-binding domain of Phe-tRNA-synthetase-like protein
MQVSSDHNERGQNRTVAFINEEQRNMFTQSASWSEKYPEAAIGVLAMSGVSNPKENEALNEQKAALERALREQFAGYDRAAFRALPAVQPYDVYYKRFKKTYHVLQQLESVVLKGRPIPQAAALVEAMFVAELKNQLLTAGHDLAEVQQPVGVDVAEGGEQYTGIGGQELVAKRGDMMIADARAIISSIIYGPDRRTRITPATTQALFTVYAPAGIAREAVLAHLADIENYVRLVSPAAEVSYRQVHTGRA